jgi:hypothetical protein
MRRISLSALFAIIGIMPATAQTINYCQNGLSAGGSPIYGPCVSNPVLANNLSTTVKAIKNTAGLLTMVQCYNANASQIYIQVFNLASGSVVLGTTVPALSIPIAPTATGGYALPMPGVYFSTAMSVAATTTATGNTAPGTAADCNVAFN